MPLACSLSMENCTLAAAVAGEEAPEELPESTAAEAWTVGMLGTCELVVA